MVKILALFTVLLAAPTTLNTLIPKRTLQQLSPQNVGNNQIAFVYGQTINPNNRLDNAQTDSNMVDFVALP